ncbi:MAG: hypothetical protein AAB350_00195 [Patescibacteria group bacterium]
MEETQKKRKFVWIIVIFMILVVGFLSLFWLNKYKNQKPQVPVYSLNTTESKKELVPSDFPLPVNGATPTQEFQREINGYLEYTLVWDSPFSFNENVDTFRTYMETGGWNPFVMEVVPKVMSLTGQKNNTTLNIFITENSQSKKVEVQVHFSQK